MFMHRLSKIGKATLFAACVLLAGGSFMSCEDDYFYPHEEPTWLGASIYDFLKDGSEGHSYDCFVELIDSLGEKETLAHTGSKTLFIADDEAFKRFFEKTDWIGRDGNVVKSVAQMTKAQMKILLYSAMLDNAMLLDMLSSSGPNIADEGEYLRRSTGVSVIDTIELTDERPAFNKYWDVLYGKEKKTMRLAKDGSQSMLVFFLSDYLRKNSITADDINFLLKKKDGESKTYTDDEALVFSNKLVASGVSTGEFSDDTMTITCKNGYLYRLDEVLLPPSNMAEELRRRDDTRVFSHMLDRFCIPVLDENLTAEYNRVHGTNDTVYRLRYFTSRFPSYSLLEKDNANPKDGELLSIDPGANDISNSEAKECDMAAMFVPKDDVLNEYFMKGAGRFLVDNFAPDVELVEDGSDNYESLFRAIDCIPESNLSELINNLMQSSFAGTVPSKFSMIVDAGTHDEIGLEKKHVDECVIANNGVIYLLNTMFGPASYEAVSAPLNLFSNMRVVNEVYTELNYRYYLLAMKAVYSFIVPDDSTFLYYDPVSKATVGSTPTAYAFHYDNKNPKNPKDVFWFETYGYDTKTYDLIGEPTVVNSTAVSSHSARFTDIMEYLIIVHDSLDGIILPSGERNKKKYYQTKGFGTIKVDTKGDLIKFYGGEQLENGAEIVASAEYKQKNGHTFCTLPSIGLSGIPTPPTRSVYDNIVKGATDETHPFYEFGLLCEPEPGMSSVLLQLFPDESADNIQEDSTKLYSIFYTSKEKANDGSMKPDNKMISLVPFFNTYHYTVYVPSNEAIKEQIDSGLPQWDDILEMAKETPKKAAAEMRLLNSFLRYHFQDNSVYVDDVDFALALPGGGFKYEANFSTALVDPKTGRFYETTIKSDAGTLLIKDQKGRTARVDKNSGAENKTWNVMARDMQYVTDGTEEEIPDYISTSSFAVIHSIDNVLLHEGLFGFDGEYRRYANDGELVDEMNIVHGGETVAHRVANYGKAAIADENGVMKTVRLAYLMEVLQPADPAYNKYTHEAYRLDENGEKILITEEGFLVEIVEPEDEDEPVTYKYAVDEANNRLKIDKNGNVTKDGSSK